MALILSVADKEIIPSYISKPQANWTIGKLPCFTLVKLRSASPAKLAKGGRGSAKCAARIVYIIRHPFKK